MLKIEVVFFWLGGVLTETMFEALARILYKQPLVKVPIEDRLYMRQLSEQLMLGAITTPVFLARIVEQSKLSCDINLLSEQIVNSLPTQKDVLAVVGALPEDCECWLIFDYPSDWSTALGIRVGVGSSGGFSPDHVIFTSQLRLQQTNPDLFHALAAQTARPINRCLVVDADTPRAVQAVRHHMHATIYVDAARLRRDFILRRLLPQPPGFVMPGPRPLY